MSNHRDHSNPPLSAENQDIAQRYEGAPKIEGAPPSHNPRTSGASAGLMFIKEIGKQYQLHEFNELKRDLVNSHGKVAGALSDIDAKKHPDGGVLVRAYGLAGQDGRIHDHQGIDIVKGTSLRDALQHLPQHGGGYGAHQYIWIGKNSTPANAPDYISTLNAREYLQYVYPQMKLRSDNVEGSPTNSFALVEGNRSINDQYRSLNEQAIALGVSNPSDQAAVALKTLHGAKGYNPESGGDLKLMMGNHGGLIVSQGEGSSSLNLRVPQAEKGDFEKVSTELAATAETQKTISQMENREISETQRQSSPVRA
jgi:hypothetical protein